MQLPAQVEAALRDYDRRRDRAAPPVFVGRQRELAFLHGTVAAARSGAAGITAVVQGVPGVGTSALQEQFEKELGSALADDPPTAVVSKDCDFLDSTPMSLVQELATDVPLRTDSAMQPNLDEASSLGFALDTFAEQIWPAGITLILSIKEMQRIEDTLLVRRNLRAIHGKRFNTNIAIVGFGLQGTKARLREIGLSRLATDQVATLGCMDPTEAASLVDKTLDSFGFAADNDAWRDHLKALGLDIDDWTEWRNAARAVVLEESVGFPHHLVNGIRGICRLILDGALRTPAQPRWEILRQQCQRHKAEYYAAQALDAGPAQNGQP